MTVTNAHSILAGHYQVVNSDFTNIEPVQDIWNNPLVFWELSLEKETANLAYCLFLTR